jgi:hypothetical protein
MKTSVLSFVALSFMCMPCFAQDESGCEEYQLRDGTVWSCQIPTQPPGPPTCHIFGNNLLCDKEPVISAPVAKRSPSNCGWNSRRGKYVCW